MKAFTEIADILELRVWASRSAYTMSRFEDELESAVDEDEDDPGDIAEKVFDVVELRSQLLGDAYPFTFDGVRLALRPAPTAPSSYLFCLGLSLLPSGVITLQARTVEFERLAKTASEKYFNGVGVRVGAPWNVEAATWEELLGRVRDLVPSLGNIIEPNAPGGGDCGWDIIVVSNFADQHWPRLIILGNCATGRTDWLAKGQEAAQTFFWERHYERPGLRSATLTFFAIPFVFEDEDDRLRKRYDNGITFDRIRLAQFAPTCSNTARTWLEGCRGVAVDIPFV